MFKELASEESSSKDGLKILKELADLLTDIERRRCPQGPDLAFTKPTRGAFNMLHSSFKKTHCEKGIACARGFIFDIEVD